MRKTKLIEGIEKVTGKFLEDGGELCATTDGETICVNELGRKSRRRSETIGGLEGRRRKRRKKEKEDPRKKPKKPGSGLLKLMNKKMLVKIQKEIEKEIGKNIEKCFRDALKAFTK